MAATSGRTPSSELSSHTPSRCRVPVLPEWRRKRHLSRWPERRVRGGHERDASAVDSGPRFAHRPRASRHRWGQAPVLVARQPRDRLFHEQRPAAHRRVWSGGRLYSHAHSIREAARGMPTGRSCSVPTLSARCTRSAPPAERLHRSPHCRPVNPPIDGRSSCQTVARSSTSCKDPSPASISRRLTGRATRSALFNAISEATYVPGQSNSPGYLLWVARDTVMAQPFDSASAQLMGSVVAVPGTEDVASSLGTSRASVSVSNDGTLLYSAGGSRYQLGWFET